ncbi:unnamed protein product [Rotaria magnacalcarata]|uniref:HAT C-terminal dimerisation domain-containing protein n=2 Tax=Rotaria magnacalcarata TaxID=392030 RepID=A0A819RKD1_9BILA|nr:unnamed protein product [Rotaria magnacalcarata]
MSSKNSKKNRDSDSTLSSHSPYNLRRNTSQAGGITKRKVSKKVDRDGNGRASSHQSNSSISRVPATHPLSSSSEDESTNTSDTDEMDHSNDEQEAEKARHETQKQKKKQSTVREHFEYLDDNTYMCQLCFKPIKTAYNNDCNLRSHLGRAHNMFEVMYESQKRQRVSKSSKIRPEKKREYHQAALNCIVTDGRPFGEFRRAGMAKFLDVVCPGYLGPSRKTIGRRLGIAYHQYREELRNKLVRVDWIALTVDIWTKNKISYICITGHAFNKGYEAIPIVLGFRRFSGPHKSKNIKEYILYELKQLKIEEKICAIVSDNGRDIKKAVEEIKPGQRISCVAHTLNLVTTTDMYQYNSESDDDAEFDTHNIDVPEDLEEDEVSSDEENSSENDEENDIAGASTENDSDLENADNNSTTDEEPLSDDDLDQSQNIQYSVHELIQRIRACVSNVRGIRAVNDYVIRKARSNDPPIKSNLVTDFEIRWNTTFIMIDRFVIYRSIIDDINSRPFKIAHITSTQQVKLGSKEFEFNNDEWNRINDLHTVLKPFLIATKIISAKNYPTLSTTYSVQYCLRHFLSESSENDSIWLKRFKVCLLEKFQLYFAQKISQYQRNTCLVVAFLDPSEYHRLRQRPVELENALTLLKREMESEMQVTRTNPTTTTTTISSLNAMKLSSASVAHSNMDNLFSLCGIETSLATSPSVGNSLSIDEEIGYYISSINTNPEMKFSRFWTENEKKLPIMSAIVRRTNIIPATSVPCESMFSIAGYVRRKERCSLSSRAIKYSLVLKDRQKLELFDL